MKHHLALYALLCAAVMSGTACAVPYTPQETDLEYSEPDSLLVTVVFSASGKQGSKVTGVTDGDERNIGRWSIFAFDDESGSFHYETSESGGPLPLRLAAGRNYTCYAIVNYPESGVGAFDPSRVRNPKDLTRKTAYLGDNRASSLLMFGSTGIVRLPQTDTDVTINVRRLVSRIDLRGLKVDFSKKPSLAGKTFTLRSVYVTNAYRTTLYGDDYSFSGLSSTRSAWYNTGGWHRGEMAEAGIDAILGDIGINTVISAGSPYTGNHSFYAFPNPAPVSQDVQTMDAWTRRCTRLVIEASIDSDIVYYAITVPEMTRNHIYAASNVIIHGRGSKDPEIIDIDPDVIEVSLTPVIEDGWDGAGSITLD